MQAMIQQVDGAILLWIQQYLRCPVLTAILCPFTHLGDKGAVWIALCLVLLLIPRTRRLGCQTSAALALDFVTNNLVLKNLLFRARPWLSVEGLVPLITEKDPGSFPSGHAAAAFAVCCVLAARLPKKWAPWPIAAAALMALSRLYVGVHYPSDVLAGSIVGACAALLVLWADRRIQKKKATR